VLASPPMRSRFLLLASLVATALGATSAGAACSTGGSPPQDPADGATSAQPAITASAEAVASAEPAEAPSAIGPTGEITNAPPSGGVVMDNASPPGTTSVTTRLQPIIDVMVANREKYRACLDGWGQANPGRELKVTLSIKLDKEGALESAAFKPDETDVADKTIEACMSKVSNSLKFPASPAGQPTRYNHRFVFKAKKS
jgi:hypothetical protein